MAKSFEKFQAGYKEVRRWRNSLSDKVQRGTPIFGQPSLCNSCTAATIVKGQAESQENVYCSTMDKTIRIKVAECNKYHKIGEPSLYDMRQIAWPLCTDKSGKKIGFMSPSDLRKRKDKEDLNIAGNTLPEDTYDY